MFSNHVTDGLFKWNSASTISAKLSFKNVFISYLETTDFVLLALASAEKEVPR